MSYYNPKIYNYHNLSNEDKKVVICLIYQIESLESMEADYVIYEEDTVLEKVHKEIAIETLVDAQERLKCDIVEFMVARIDTYEGDVKEIETDDYFYGYPLAKDENNED